jgi:hypothetical protein
MGTNPFRRRLLRLAVTAAVVPVALLPFASASASSSAAAAAPSFTKIEGAAADAAGLQPTVDAYRALLGEPNNGSTPGSQPAGRRAFRSSASRPPPRCTRCGSPPATRR